MRVWLFVAAALAVSSPSLAAEAAAARTADQVDADLLATLGNDSLEAFVAKVLAPIRATPDGNRLTRQYVDEAAERQRASQRGMRLGQLLGNDLDGDGAVTAEEFRKAHPPSGVQRNYANPASRSAADTRDLEIMSKFDADRDGRLDIPEMRKAADTEIDLYGARKRADLPSLLLELDADGDGATSAAEAETRARHVFAAYDKDGDGLIDPGTREAIAAVAARRQDAIRKATAIAECTMPKPDPTDRLVMFDAQRAKAISSVALGDPNRVTQTLPVTIEPGSGSIYLVLASRADTIWRIGGAVERVSRLVLLDGAQGFGAMQAETGIDRDKVAWAKAVACDTRGIKLEGNYRERNSARHEVVLGRRYDAAVQEMEASSVSVPSLVITGKKAPAREGNEAAACQRSLRARSPELPRLPSGEECTWFNAEKAMLYPDGLVDIAPTSIVSQALPLPYEVLPSPFGYLKALDDGTLRDVSGGDQSLFRIVKPLKRIPPGQNQARRLNLRLAEGLPVPDGAAVNVCVFDSKGQVVSGDVRRCESAE